MTRSSTRTPMSRRGLITSAGAVVVLAAASTVTAAAASGAFNTRSSTARGPACTAPALPGAMLSVRLADMRSMMTRGGTMGGRGGMMGGRGGMMGNSGMMGQGDWRYFRHGMMRVLTSTTSVPAGTVSLAVTNTGYLTHELVVLPLAAGQQPGTRTVGGGGKVEETGSLGEASASCRAGEGDGIAAGSTSWVSLHLPAGRYELVCNLPGHYAAGMFAELDVH